MLNLLLSEKEAFYGHILINYIIGGYDDGSHKNTFIRNVK